MTQRREKAKLRQLTRLVEPFAAGLIEQKTGSFESSYVPHEIYTQKLLAILGPHSFQVEEVIYSAERIVEGVLASMTLTIDGRTETVQEVGDVEESGQKKNNGQRAKEAASDAYKRCAMRFGVGLHLWCKPGKFILYQLLKTRDTQGGDNGSQPADKSDPPPTASATPASVAAPTLPPCTDDADAPTLPVE